MTNRRFLLLLALVLVVGACEVRTHLLIDASNLSAGRVSAVVGFDEEFRNLMEESGGAGDVMAELESEAEGDGWETEPFVDEDIEGLTLTRGFSSVEELQGLMESGMLSEDWGYTDISFTEDDGDFIFEAAGGNPMSEFSGGEDIGDLTEFLTVDFQLAVTFPGPVEDHNGVLEDRTVTWQLDDLESESGTLFGRSSIGGGFPWAIIGGVLLALVIAGVVVWRLRESKPQATEVVIPVVMADWRRVAPSAVAPSEGEPVTEDPPPGGST